MIIYEREKKTLIIPTGIGNGNLGGGDYADGYEAGKVAQKAADDRKITPTTAITQNGEYEADYGFKKVIVDVECGGDCSEEVEAAYNSGWTGGYGEGKDDGVAEQKAKLGSISITNNGTYSRPDGYGTVEVQVEGGTCNLESKPFSLESGTIFPATISPSEGYDGLSEVTVQDNGYGQKKYDDGFSDGQDNIRSNMGSAVFTQNGNYSNSSGWSSVTVNVSSGSASNLQNKSVVLTAGTQTVVPDAGYDGMTEVEVDATNMLSNERSAGYSQGVDDVRNQFTSTAVTQNGTYQMTGEFNAFSSFTVNVESAPQLEIRSYNLDENWGGESGEVYPNDSLGFVGFRYFMVNDIGYGQKKYDDGYADGYESGSTSVVYYTTKSKTVMPADQYSFFGYDEDGNFAQLISNTYDGYGKLVFDRKIVNMVSLFRQTESRIIDVNALYIPEGVRTTNQLLVATGSSELHTDLAFISFPPSLEYIATRCCWRSDITSVYIPDNVTRINSEAFANCYRLNTIHIGKGCTTIEDYAFGNAGATAVTGNLQTIICEAYNAPSITANTFANIKDGGTLYVPSGRSISYDTWMNNLPSGWTISDTL